MLYICSCNANIIVLLSEWILKIIVSIPTFKQRISVRFLFACILPTLMLPSYVVAKEKDRGHRGLFSV